MLSFRCVQAESPRQLRRRDCPPPPPDKGHYGKKEEKKTLDNLEIISRFLKTSRDKIYTEGAANGGLSPSACPRLLKRLLRLRRRIEEELMKASILVKFRMERGGDNVFLTDGYGHAVEDD